MIREQFKILTNQGTMRPAKKPLLTKCPSLSQKIVRNQDLKGAKDSGSHDPSFSSRRMSLLLGKTQTGTARNRKNQKICLRTGMQLSRRGLTGFVGLPPNSYAGQSLCFVPAPANERSHDVSQALGSLAQNAASTGYAGG